jgi:catechol 2,3-dioxygenase-like lactoylglutathione lyase family enzyme
MSFPAAVHHIALTVSDLATSRAWYTALLGTEPVLDEDVPVLSGHHQGFHHTILVLSGGTVLALHAHPDGPPRRHFDERDPGLDHLGFHCADRTEIDRLRSHLDRLGIAHSDVAEDDLGIALAFRDPDGIALEFWAPRA